MRTPNVQNVFLVASEKFAARTDVGRAWMVAYLRGVRDYNDAIFKRRDRDAVIQILMESTLVKDRPWTYGLPANARTLEKFLAYCDAMGVTARPLTPRDLFHPDTWDLTEEVV